MTAASPALLTLPNACALAILLSLIAYAVSAGADFGGGVWDLLAHGERADAQRALVSHAIAPIWEANHVWLVLVVVLLFTCFPPAFALIGIYLHVPLVLMLVGIVLRGSAFVFRAYDVRQGPATRRWGRVFAVTSVITPVVLGTCVGAIASGALGRIPPGAGVYATFFAPWLAPFPLACGALALAAFSFLAATYLTLETEDAALRDDFRARALWSAAAVFVAAFGALAISHATVPALRRALTASPWALPLQGATAVAAVVAIAALWTRRWQLARIAAAGQVVLILLGWAGAQYPALIPGRLTIADAAAPTRTLALTLVALALGGATLFPSLWYLYRVFRAPGTTVGGA